MAFARLLYQKDGPIARVTLNRPERLNALDLQMRDDLSEVLPAVWADDEVRVVVFKGAGEKAFSVGADLNDFGTAPSIMASRHARWARDNWSLFIHSPKPLIAAIHGFALGVGCELALLCDLRIASEDAVLALPEVELGMIPGAGGSQTVSRVVKRGAGTELLLWGSRLSAAEALRIGLVQRVVPRTELYPTAEAMARAIASHDPRAVRFAREAIYQGAELSLAEGLDREQTLAAILAGERRTTRPGPPP